MTHGHELRGGLLEGMGVPGGGVQRRENLDKCNSIINKIYLKFFLIKKKFKILKEV